MYTLSDFQAKVSTLVAGRTDSNSFDLTDENTKTYVQGLVSKVTESAKCETKDLFGFTQEQFTTALAASKFSELVVEGADNPEMAVMEAAATAISEDVSALFGLFKDFGEKQDDLLKDLTPVTESSTETINPTEAAAPVVPEVTPLETVVEGTPAAPADPAAPAEGTEAPVAEAATITIVPATERTDDTPWGQVDKAAIKEKLRAVKEAGGEGADEAIAEVYAVVGSVDDPSTWKYPHHIIEESGAIVLSVTGLAAASNYIQSGRFSGTEEVKQAAAGHLQGHYDSIQQTAEEGTAVKESAGYPAGLGVTASKTPGVRMVSVDLIKEDTIIPFEEAALTEEGKNIAVVEACANLLHCAGQLSSIVDPTILTISPAQMTVVQESLSVISHALMGNLPQGNELIIKADTTLIAESAAQVEKLTAELNAAMATNSQLTRDIELLDSKIDALSTLSEGSALEGIAESVVSSKTLEQVRAFKAVTDNPGLKRLITAAGNANPAAPAASPEKIQESSPGTKGLENLDTIFEEEKDKNPSKKKGSFAALYV